MTTQTPPHHGSSSHGPEPSNSHRYPPPPPPMSSQPNYPAQAAITAKPSTYWVLSIIAFLCSFIIGGIGMYFSAQVTSRWNAGNVEGARKASKTALIIDLVGIVIGFLLIVSSLSGG
jgi:Interferon-induced transmembrane protein